MQQSTAQHGHSNSTAHHRTTHSRASARHRHGAHTKAQRRGQRTMTPNGNDGDGVGGDGDFFLCAELASERSSGGPAHLSPSPTTLPSLLFLPYSPRRSLITRSPFSSHPLPSPTSSRPFYLNPLSTSSHLPHGSSSHNEFTLYQSTNVTCTWPLASELLFIHSALDRILRTTRQVRTRFATMAKPTVKHIITTKNLCFCVFFVLDIRLK